MRDKLIRRIRYLKESIRDKRQDEQGMTIVEVMVAFVLVLLAIAMITTATSMATKIQKTTQESQKKTTFMTELAYRALQSSYDETNKRWQISVDASNLDHVSAVTQLEFSGAGESFHLNLQTADLVVSSTDGAIQARYHIYQ